MNGFFGDGWSSRWRGKRKTSAGEKEEVEITDDVDGDVDGDATTYISKEPQPHQRAPWGRGNGWLRRGGYRN